MHDKRDNYNNNNTMSNGNNNNDNPFQINAQQINQLYQRQHPKHHTMIRPLSPTQKNRNNHNNQHNHNVNDKNFAFMSSVFVLLFSFFLFPFGLNRGSHGTILGFS